MTDYGRAPRGRCAARCDGRHGERRKAIFVAFHDLIPGTTYVKRASHGRRNCAPSTHHGRDPGHHRRAARAPRPDFHQSIWSMPRCRDKLNDRELFDQIFGICGASLVGDQPRRRRPLYCSTRTTTSAGS